MYAGWTILFIGENPRLCRGDSQSLTFPGCCTTQFPVLGS